MGFRSIYIHSMPKRKLEFFFLPNPRLSVHSNNSLETKARFFMKTKH